MENSITKYISENRNQQSRYEIDRSLLRAGYEPEQIEAVWEQILPFTAKPRKKFLTLNFLNSVEFWVFTGSLALAVLAIRPIMPTGSGANIFIISVLGIAGLVLLHIWNREQKAKGARRSKFLIGAYLNLIVVIICMSLAILATLGSSVNPVRYLDLGKLPVNGANYHAVYQQGCCDGPDYQILLYKCDFTDFFCSKIEQEMFSLDSPGLEKYEFSKDQISNRFIVTNRNEVVYTFRSY